MTIAAEAGERIVSDAETSRVSAWQQWLADTHGPQFESLRHFLRELFSSELVASPEYLRRSTIGLLGLTSSFGRMQHSSSRIFPQMLYSYSKNIPV